MDVLWGNDSELLLNSFDSLFKLVKVVYLLKVKQQFE